ncbi:MAG: hypothetical protein M3Y53_11600, partial [Thermoproteota archaeon]|nr:hypothetical protein [Thermoproteota archaeon]
VLCVIIETLNKYAAGVAYSYQSHSYLVGHYGYVLKFIDDLTFLSSKDSKIAKFWSVEPSVV